MPRDVLRRKNRAVVALGSNIRPDANIPEARKRISERFSVLAESRFVRTEPIGPPDQPAFVNGAILLETDLSLRDVEKELKGIEIQLGRVRTNDKFAPRTIDLDIAVWNARVVEPHLHEREFLKKAVEEIWPEGFPMR